MSRLSSALGQFTLTRWPASVDRSLQAWDAADELLIKHLCEKHQPDLDRCARVLICNDAHGALTCALHAASPVNWSDSFLAHTAARMNWQANRLPGAPCCVDSMTTPSGIYDLVLIKVPKTYALLEDQLARIRPLLHANSVVIAASMVRHLQRSAFALFEKYLGPVTTSLSVKKARLVFCHVEPSQPLLGSPYPDHYTDKALDITMLNHANVFCRDKVDSGARFFIAHCHRLPKAMQVIDLACGNGILGIHVQKVQPSAQLYFIDESYMAVASAQHNYHALIASPPVAPQFFTGDALEPFSASSVDLIICNPPFHVQHAIALDTARLFFQAAAGCLNSAGELWIVANRHLAYRNELKRHFRVCELIAGNQKFVVIRAASKIARS